MGPVLQLGLMRHCGYFQFVKIKSSLLSGWMRSALQPNQLPLQRNISCTVGNEITCELFTSHMSSTWVLWESQYNQNWIDNLTFQYLPTWRAQIM